MSKYRNALPQIGNGPFIHYVGMETDLIFNHGIDLPGFASYPLLATEDGTQTVRNYYRQLMNTTRSTGAGVILDSTTWVANRDRAAAIGIKPQELHRLNLAAIDLIAEVRKEGGDLPTVLCAQMGPRGDGYAPGDLMTTEQAEDYHSEQMQVIAQSQADFAAGFTLCYPQEAIGIVRAGQKYGMPVAISFTVETDGHLPTGMPLREAIETVDAATDSAAAYFLINCAHPDHFSSVLTDEPWILRLKGAVANASRCSHAELDEAGELDDGDPVELGTMMGNLSKTFPHFTIFGGCCGTDMRHVRNIAQQVVVAKD